MKTIFFYLSLVLFISTFTQISAQKTYTFTGCIVDQNEQALVYADIQIGADKTLQTDVDGCYHFEYEKMDATAKISYPGFLQKEITLLSTEEQKLVLNAWKNERLRSVETHAPIKKPIERERFGDYLLSGQVVNEDKEPLIGVSIQLGDGPYGTITDIDGKFKLYTEEKCNMLHFSYIGFEKKSSNICADTSIEVFMKEEEVLLDEVTVTSMSSSRKDRKLMKRSEMATPRTLSYEMTDAPMSAPPPPPPATMAIEATEAVYEYHDAAVLPASKKMSAEDAFMRDGMEKGKTEPDNKLPDAGQLTAGEVNDFSKWEMWSDISQEDLAEHRSVWHQYADHRYSLQLTTPDGLPIINAPVQLNDGQGNTLWRARTNNSGQAEMWAHYFLETEIAANGLSITGTVGRKSFDIPNAKSFKEGINFHSVRTECNEEPVIDIAFVIDATGSMGDEITYLQAELLNVIARINDSLPAADVQSASIFYKDKTDDYLTKINDFSKDAATTVKFIQGQRAGGGGDFPEAVDDAMEAAVNKLKWRDEATSRLLFLVLDAPPHQEEENIKRMQVAVTKAATMGIQIIPVACSGINKSTEYLMRSMALATNGTYTFITDHSGIGNAHIEPSTDDYTVEFLNDVLVRLSVDRSHLQSCDETPIAKIDETPFTVDGDDENESWSYYPNPTMGPLNFRFENSDGMLHLFDAHGKLLQRAKANKRLELDLGAYPAGTYWLKHENTEGVWTQGQVLLVRR